MPCGEDCKCAKEEESNLRGEGFDLAMRMLEQWMAERLTNLDIQIGKATKKGKMAEAVTLNERRNELVLFADRIDRELKDLQKQNTKGVQA